MALSVNIKDIPTKGAGPQTAGQLGANRRETGVDASNALAAEDAERMRTFKDSIRSAAQETGIDAAVIAAIISRETRAGNYLGSNGWNSSQVAFGIMQVHKMHSPTQWGKDSQGHITQAANLLKGFILGMNTSWTAVNQYKGGIAAYNCGPTNVKSPDKVDENTEGKDYANDVVARAKWFKNHGY